MKNGSEYNAHSSQLVFLLSKVPYDKEQWHHETLASNYTLSWHERLTVTFNHDKSVALVGDAWQTDPTKESPSSFIANAPEDDALILSEEKNWCGKYILIIGSRIYLDAAGFLCVFYSDANVTNSLALLCKIESRKLKFPKIAHELGPNYIPGIYTEYDGVKRVLPSMSLDYVKGTITTRKMLPDGVIECASNEERTDMFIRRYGASLRNMSEHFKGREIWLALTGGKDSRVTMSVLEHENIDYRPFALEHGYISEGDVKVPPLLAEAVGKEPMYIKRDPKNYSEERMREFVLNCAGMAEDGDKLFHTYGQYQAIPRGTDEIIMLRSGLFECAVPEYFGELSRKINEYFDGRTNIHEVINVFGVARYNKTISRSFIDWLDYVKGDKLNSELTLDSRFYLELRAGCWLSSVEQSLSIEEGLTSVQPLNSRYFISLLSGYDKYLRMNKRHQELIVLTACPATSYVPYGDVYKGGRALTKREFYAKFRELYGLPVTFAVRSARILKAIARRIFKLFK